MRTWLITVPERIRLARRVLGQRLERAILRRLDRWLAARGEERTAVLLDFDELPVLYQELDFSELAIEEAWSER